MSLFKKPKRNFRSRETEYDDEEEALENNQGKAAAPKKDKKAVTKSQSLLSFNEDWNDGDDGEVFQVKKSSQSKKMRKLLDKERKKKKDPNDNEKKTITKTKITTEDDIVITVKNTLPILNGREAEAASIGGISSEEEEEIIGHHKFSQSSRDVKTLLQRGSIPDAATIHAARKQRQHRREMGDFIPVSEESNSYDKENGSSGRLIREDDGSDADEERIKMSVDTASEDRLLLRAQFNAAQQKDSGESENYEEEEEWEAQQIRKGVTGAQIAAVQQETFYYQQYLDGQLVPPAPPIISDPLNCSTVIGSVNVGSVSAAPSFPQVPVSTQVSTALSIITRLKSSLDEVNIVRNNHQKEMRRWQDDVEFISKDIEMKKEAAPKLETKYNFYQEIRGYVTDLVECLDEKILIIDKLEERVLNLNSKRIQQGIARRRQDVQDQATELPILSSGKNIVREEAMVRRVAEREGRRIRRQRARELKISPIPHIDGMSSDDESTEVEIINEKSARVVIERDCMQVFEDTLDDFSTVSGILKKFEEWRAIDINSYAEAYAPLCIPKMLAPIIRLHSIFWNPLTGSSTDFEKTDWCQTLLLYGISHTETEDDLRKDPDAQLLPRVIDKVILPKLSCIVRESWDALSTSQTIHLVSTVTKIIQDYPTLCYNSKSLKALFESVVNKMRIILDNDVFIPIYPKQRISDGKVLAFFMRQCAVAVKLLGNMARWQGLLTDEILTELAIDSLLNRYIITALKNCQPVTGANIVHMVGSVLPRVWLSTCVSQLSPFLNHVKAISLSLNLEKPVERDAMERMNVILKSVF